MYGLKIVPAAPHGCSPSRVQPMDMEMKAAVHDVLQGLQLPMSENKLTPLLLSRLAAYASGKADSLKAVTGVLPELCQVHPDFSLPNPLLLGDAC